MARIGRRRKRPWMRVSQRSTAWRSLRKDASGRRPEEPHDCPGLTTRAYWAQRSRVITVISGWQRGSVVLDQAARLQLHSRLISRSKSASAHFSINPRRLIISSAIRDLSGSGLPVATRPYPATADDHPSVTPPPATRPSVAIRLWPLQLQERCTNGKSAQSNDDPTSALV